MPRSPKEKKEKNVKKFPLKKLPRSLKKKYTEKKLNKKFLKKIYIPADKKIILNLFSEKETTAKGKELLFVPADKTFTKAEIKHLKKIIKEIKNQKGRIRLLPLAVTAGFIFAVLTGITLTKNIIAKKVIVSAVQSVAKARCDIKSVNIKFIDSTFDIRGFEVADKDKPMRNVFSFDSLTVDFDMLQLLKSKFVANELSVEGIKIHSERTYDGTLPPKALKKINKNEEKAQKEPSPLMLELQNKSKNSIDIVKNSLTGTFDQFNPETMFKNYYASLKTPEVAARVQAEVPALITRYSAKPAEFEAKVKKGTEVVNSVINIDYNALANNPVKLKEALEALTEAYNYTVQIKNESDSLMKEINADFKMTSGLATDIQKAFKNDTSFVQNEIGKIKSLTLDDGMNFISGTFDSILCELLGKYYPYVDQAKGYLDKINSNKKEKKAKEKKNKISRAAGRNVYYRKDTVPSFWIKKVSTSGEGFYGKLLDVSSDMDKTGKPVTGEVGVSLFGLEHNANVVVDTRSKSTAPLVTVDYNCNNVPVSFPLSYFDNTPGVPGIESSKALLDFVLEIFENDGFSLSGSGNFREVNMVTTPFEPAFISDIYVSILSNIKDFSLKLKSGYTVSNGLDLQIISDIDKVFGTALEKEVRNQIDILKVQVQTEVMNKINEYTNNAFGELKTFEDLQKEINKYINMANDLPKQIEAKQKEVENMMKKGVENEINKYTDQAKERTQNELKNQFKKLF